MNKIWVLAVLAILAISFGCTSVQPAAVAGAACTKEQCLAKGKGWVPDLNGITGAIITEKSAALSATQSCNQFYACMKEGKTSTECANKFIGYTLVDKDGCIEERVDYYCPI